MNEIKIIELSLRNFKGIKEFKLKADGNNVNVYGDNATGKTSIMDGFIWLLFNKDSQNSSNFNIKTLDKLGDVINGLEHEVIAKLEINDKIVELQKMYKEKWTKKRGQAESELTGHTTDYFINGVPKKKSEYEQYLANLIDEETFRIITNPLYFNQNVKWQDRRNIALSICGSIEDKDVIDKEPELKDLKDLLIDKSIDDLKAEMTARRRKLNEELKSIPYRIDELSREDLDVDTEEINKQLEDYKGRLVELKESDGGTLEFRLRTIVGTIKKLEGELNDLEYNALVGLREELNKLMDEISKINKSYHKEDLELAELTSKNDKIAERIKKIKKQLEDLREKFIESKNKEIDSNADTCPTCRQMLPADEISRIFTSFEDEKQEHLKAINVEGKALKEDLEESNKKEEELRLQVLEKEGCVHMLSEMLQGKKEEKEDLEEQINNISFVDDPQYKEISNKIDKLVEERKSIENLIDKQDKSLEIGQLETKIDNLNKELAKVDIAEDNEKRVKELKDRERELAQMVAGTEKIEFLCERFIITKADLLEDKLNDMFSLVKFKLFEKQVNGGINETFVTTVDGVPFEDLNNAMRINAGLDIIRTLADYYNMKSVIFIDNAESINNILDIEAQIIKLIVSKHKSLRVEVD